MKDERLPDAPLVASGRVEVSLVGRRINGCWSLDYEHPDGNHTTFNGRSGQGLVSATEDLVQAATSYALAADLARAGQ